MYHPSWIKVCSQVSQKITVLFSQTEKEVIALDASNCSSETLHRHLPSSFPKYITKICGELSAPLESDIRTIVPSGAIPTGKDQDVVFGVLSEEKILLRDIPETPGKVLISPVAERGPHDIHLSKLVEIIVSHCRCLSDAKKDYIITQVILAF